MAKKETRSRIVDAVEPASESRDGTQAIRRAASILKAIARADPDGLSAGEIAQAKDLAKSTAHRILKCLVDEGFVDYDPDTRRYQIGALIHDVGLSLSTTAMEVGKWRALVEAVARRTGVTSYLMRRSGAESVCLLKVEGNSVVRVIPVEVGQRRPLVLGAGATALLAALDDATAQRIIAALAPLLRSHPRLDERVLRQALRDARAKGYAVSRGIVVEEVFGLGVAIPDPEAAPSLAVSVAVHISLATDANVANWARIMQEEVRAATSPRQADVPNASSPARPVRAPRSAQPRTGTSSTTSRRRPRAPAR